jgi:hypothetical protein
MFDPERGDVDLAGERCYRFSFLPMQFAHVTEALPTKQTLVRRAVSSNDQSDGACVDLWQLPNGQCGRGQAFGSDRKPQQPDSDPWKKNWIRENHYPEKID